jgi:hypothetical protein
MTIIAKNFAAKLSVAVVAVAMVFSAFASSASAQTAEELQQMINDLLAQIAQLEASAGVGTGAGVCVSIPAPLTIGSTGADVTALQNVLIDNGYVIPAGATGYFGTQTQSALAAWQADQGISPAVGYYGPITKAALDAACDTQEDDMDDDMDDMDDDMDDDDDMMELQGEGTLSMFEVDEEETEISEGEEDVVAAEITVEAEDGDILISRMTIDLIDATRDTGEDNEEGDPWDVFETFSLWVDGDMIAEFDASDEDEYTDEDGPAYTFRFTDLDLVVEEDEEVEVLFAVSVANSVDGSDLDDRADWAFHVSEIRYFDADDVAVTEDSFDDLSNEILDSIADATDITAESGVFAFDIEEAGTDDQADIESSSADPDQATLRVEDDNSDSEDYTVFVFDIDVDDESSDLLVGDALIDVVVTNASTTQSYDIDDVIAEITMTIDGESQEGDDNNTQTSVVSGVSTTTFEFEFDEDVELEADEEYEVTVEISFVGTDNGDNYAPGTTIQLFVDGQEWEVEGVENDNELEGDEMSEVHTLNTVVPIISDVESEATADDPNDSGRISFEFTVEADGDDDIEGFDIADVIFSRTSNAASPLTPAGGLTLLSGDADETGAGEWTIRDGDEATFALDFNYTTASSGNDGTYRVNLERVLGVEVDETSQGLSLSN